MDPYGDDSDVNALAMAMGVPAQMQLLQAKRQRAMGLIGTPMPQGQTVGRTFVASSPLEHLAAAMSRTMGYQQARQAEDAMGPLVAQQQAGNLVKARLENFDRTPAPAEWGAPAGMQRGEALKVLPSIVKANSTHQPKEIPEASFEQKSALYDMGHEDLGMLDSMNKEQAFKLYEEGKKAEAKVDLKSIGGENVHWVPMAGQSGGGRYVSGSGRVYEPTPDGGIGRQISGPRIAEASPRPSPAAPSSPAPASPAPAPGGGAPSPAPGVPGAPKKTTKLGMTEDGYPLPRNVAEKQALAIARGEMPPPSGPQLYGRGGAMLSDALARYKVDVPGKQALWEQFKGDSASYRKQVQVLDLTKSWETTGRQNLATLREAVGAVNSDSRFANKGLLFIKDRFGSDPNVTKLMAARSAVVNEYAKILAGNTGSAGVTEGARHEAEAMIPLDATPAQVEGAIQVLERDAGNRLGALQGQLEETKKRMATGMRTGSAVPSTAPESAPSGTVDVMWKGKRKTIPAARLDEALKAGATKAD